MIPAETLCPDCRALQPCRLEQDGSRTIPRHRAHCGRMCAAGREPRRDEHHREHCRRKP